MDESARVDEAYFQIGEAADRLGLTQRTLRYYEEKGLLRPPSRMDGGFRLYSEGDLARLERIKELKELLGFSLADIKDMLDADEIRLQLKSGWRKDADVADKAAKIRVAREATVAQLRLLDEKMEKMSSLREELASRMARYDGLLLQWSAGNVGDEAAPGTSTR
ncbi:MAG: MerR family transcriptional regulator [Dehalococcoidia bacterium]|nr:MerR family transcriptional regulator [Dehalococcoidia bacterium]